MRLPASLTFIAAMLIAACTTPHSMHGGSPHILTAACKGQDTEADCYIVVDAWMTASDSCAAEVVKSQETVAFKKNAPDKWIQWKLTDSSVDENFRFTGNGIAPKSTPADNATKWRANFTNGGTIQNDKVFRWKNLNSSSVTTTSDYLYMVSVELRRPHLAPLACKLQDPVIRNQR